MGSHPLQCGYNGWPNCPPVQSVVTQDGRVLEITGATKIEDVTDRAQETAVHVPDPAGQVDLLDPAEIAHEAAEGNAENAAEYGNKEEVK
jgi:hypothetical protein